MHTGIHFSWRLQVGAIEFGNQTVRVESVVKVLAKKQAEVSTVCAVLEG